MSEQRPSEIQLAARAEEQREGIEQGNELLGMKSS